MAFDYQRVVYETVIPQITDKGTLITLTRIIDSSESWEHVMDEVTFTEYWENKDTGEIVFVEPGEMTEVYTAMGVITDFTEEEINNTSIKTGDKKILSIELPKPLQGDVYTIRDMDYHYVNHVTVAPGDVDVLYKIQVRV